MAIFFFSSRRRHTRYWRDWSSDVCSSDLGPADAVRAGHGAGGRAVDDGRQPQQLRGLPRRGARGRPRGERHRADRKSVVEGKRGDFGGCRILKKKKTAITYLLSSSCVMSM